METIYRLKCRTETSCKSVLFITYLPQLSLHSQMASVLFLYLSRTYQWSFSNKIQVPNIFLNIKGADTCAVCPESAWLVTFLIGNVSTGVVTWSALRCGASGESGKKVAAAPLSKIAAAAAAA